MIFQHMRVNFGRRNICMAQKHLDDPQIGPTRQQMRRKGMTHGVGGDAARINAACRRDVFDQQIEILPRHMTIDTGAREEEKPTKECGS